MDIPNFYLAVLALVQGITEFLPVSSSAHLVLLPHWLSQSDQGLDIDITLHLGTMLALVIYVRADIGRLGRGLLDLLHRRQSPEHALLLHLVIATVPIVVLGFFLKPAAEEMFRSPLLIGINSILFGVILWLCDRYGAKTHDSPDALTMRRALFFGLAQCLALMPGASRSGVTMSLGRLLGFTPFAAARFSLLMAIPVILAAMTLSAIDMLRLPGTASAPLPEDLLMATTLSFVSALLAIHLMMAWLKRAGFLPFVIYRLCLGAVLLLAFGL